MSDQTAISWCDMTFNPWHGCTKVSPACTNCYAERQSQGWPNFHDGERKPLLWGPGSERKFFGDEHWKQPERWNKAARAAGVRKRVFCASMADVFEVPTDQDLLERLKKERMRLFLLIERTPWLDWLILTKRIQYFGAQMPDWWRHGFPDNVWPGTTAESQGWLEDRLPWLLGLPARVRFLSLEPLLGAVNLRRVRLQGELAEIYVDALTGCHEGSIDALPLPPRKRSVDWVIAGGESGPHARAAHPDWFRSLRDQCATLGVPFHFKQWGEWGHGSKAHATERVMLTDGRAMTWGEYETAFTQTPGDLSPTIVARMGKVSAGRLLDGQEYNGFPEARP